MASASEIAPGLHVEHAPGADGVAVLQMKSEPVNALSSAFMEALALAAGRLAADDAVRAVVLTSGLSRPVFSAGLNLAEMIHGEADPPKALVSFMSHVGSVNRAWLAFPKPMVAAINGAAPAGGCMLSLTADYRVMQAGDRHVIGLNETQVGIQAPWWLVGLLQDAVGVRCAERMLQLGELVGPEEALARGLIDEVAPTAEATLDAAVKAAERFAAVPSHAREGTKLMLRGDLVRAMEDRAAEDAVTFAAHASEPAVQKQLRAVVQALAPRT